MRKRWKGCIANGQLVMDDPQAFHGHLQTLKGPVAVTVEKWRDTASNAQLRYYFGVIVRILQQELGMAKYEVDSVLKNMFLFDVVSIQGQPYKVVLRKHKTDTKRLEEFFEDIRYWAQDELNITIPLPHEVDTDVEFEDAYGQTPKVPSGSRRAS